jgi:hypothetical protein
MNVLKPFRAVALVCALVAFSAFGKGLPGDKERGEDPPRVDAGHTITWFCTDFNDLLDVEVPVVLGAASLVLPDPSPIADPCTPTPFPVAVPAGSGWSVGAARWFTNEVYPDAIVQALAARGFHFVSDKPMEDLLQKIVEVRYRVVTFPAGRPVAEFSFDPAAIARTFEVRKDIGRLPPPTFLDNALGIDISANHGRNLPEVSFPGVAASLPPGSYRAIVTWRFAADHNDGLGLAGGNFLRAGDNNFAAPVFIVVP